MRLKRSVSWQPGAEPIEAEASESKPHADSDQAKTPTRDVDSKADENAEPVRGVRRPLALLSNKWVLISGISGVLRAITGTALLMLMQSTKGKGKLQAELLER